MTLVIHFLGELFEMPYQFTIKGLEATGAAGAAIVLPASNQGVMLRVRLSPVDAQALACDLSGLATVRSRLAQTCLRLVEALDGVVEGVELRRGAGSLVEASLSVRTGAALLDLPVAFGDGIAIALANKLPLVGDVSLQPLMEATNEEVAHSVDDDAIIALPASFTSFVNSLPDF